MDIIPAALVPLGTLAIIFGMAAYNRMLQERRREMLHRERLAAIEKGLPIPPEEPEHSARAASGPRNYLLRGLIWFFLGASLFAAVMMTTVFAEPEERPIVARFFFAGLVPAGVGLAYLIYYAVETLKPQQPR